MYCITHSPGSKTQPKIFKALDQDVKQQVARALADPARTLARTRVERTPVSVIGEPPAVRGDGDAIVPCVELFDDGDFYQELLRELSESTFYYF